MANAPAADDKDKTTPSSGGSEPETLKPRGGEEKVETTPKDSKVTHSPVTDNERKQRLSTYRPTHKATFIGLAVVVGILGVNAAVLGFLLHKENSNAKVISSHGVSISPAVLSKLGVNDAQIGNSNELLTVDPAAQFNSTLTVGGDVSIGGQLHLNSTLNATNANLSQVQAGSESVNSININGAATTSTLSVRNNLAVNGAAIFQNNVTVGQLLSVDNNAAVSNNLSVGGQLSASSIAGGSLVVSGTITLGSHIVTSGVAPAVSPGVALGSYGSANVNGDDSAGIINVSTGAGANNGEVVHLSFHTGYAVSPVVVISPMGNYEPFYVANVTSTGFDVNVAANLTVGTSYQINYLVEQ